MAKIDSALERLSVAAIRSLVIDATNEAKSGHPGMALDIAPALYALYRDHLVSDPSHPTWVNRDRFVLSSGHNSALLYSMLHVAGFDVTMDDMMHFRKLGSRTPGHPEIGETSGVDATSGPLGQGIAQAVGMALAERSIAAHYPHARFGHYTYALCGDGCLQEGVTQEAISLAGHEHLNRLILIYDENGATLDGPTSDSLTENVELRFLACEWNVLKVSDGNDVNAVSKAIAKAKKGPGPTLIIVKTQIGFGSKNQGSHKTHGSPLGEEDGAYAKAQYGYDYPRFTVPEEVYRGLADTFAARGKAAYAEYEKVHAAFASAYPEEAKRFDDAFAHNFDSYLPRYPEFELGKAIATRSSSGKCLVALHDALPFTFGGAADVAGSVMTDIPGESHHTFENPTGRDMRWGIREFAMAACCNGIALHGGLFPYCGTFFVFSDYMKPALRMAAIEKLPVVYLLSHDSIAVGEDGPTHQPIEQFAMLRSIPGFELIRPADAHEVIGAYEIVRLKKEGPTALILSRQGLPTMEETSAEGVAKGGYLLYKPANAKYLVLATGSEVSLALAVAKKRDDLAVASLPSVSRFLAQPESYQNEVLFLPRERRISAEMGSTFGWGDLAKHHIGIDTYGASGNAATVLKHFGFDEESFAAKIDDIVKMG